MDSFKIPRFSIGQNVYGITPGNFQIISGKIERIVVEVKTTPFRSPNISKTIQYTIDSNIGECRIEEENVEETLDMLEEKITKTISKMFEDFRYSEQQKRETEENITKTTESIRRMSQRILQKREEEDNFNENV